MKKLLKALGVTALAAAVIPFKVEKDEETGVKTYQSLLSRLRVGPGEDNEGTNISLDLLDGILPTALRGAREEADYADDELELDLDSLETEPVFEMSVKVERDVPAAGTAGEAAERAEEAAEQAEEIAERAQEEAERAQEEAERAREEAERAREEADAAAEAAQAETEKQGIDL